MTSSLKKISSCITRLSSLNRHFIRRLQSTSTNVRPETVHVGCMTDIGTRTIFSEEHDIFRRSVRKFMQEEVIPLQDKFHEEKLISKEIWRKAGDTGMLGIALPEELGGVGGDILSAFVVQEEVCYSGFTSFNGMSVHSEIVMPYICHYGSPEQIKKYIPDMTAGRKIGAIAMTEPGAGSDLQGIRTTAKRDGDHWVLNGSKVFITNGINSDVVIVVARTNSEKLAAHGTSLFLLDTGTEGYSKGKNLPKMGLHASDTAELFFDDVRLSDDALLGKPDQGFYYLMQELPQERLCIAVMAVAHSEFMFEETRRYIKERHVFGKPLTNLQTVRHKMAEMKTNIYVARTFVDNCIQLHAEKRFGPEMASMAKYWTSDLQNQVANECVQLHGGWGYMMEYPIARAFVDARAQTIYGGSNEIMKDLIARGIVKD